MKPINVNSPTIKFGQVAVGAKFIFNGEVYTKINNAGEFFGICNVQRMNGEKGHLEHHYQVSYLC